MKKTIRTVLPKNLKKHLEDLANGSVRGVALTRDKRIAIEMIQEGKLLSIILANPKSMTVEHTCKFMDKPGDVGCKHLAAAVDVIAFLNGKRIKVTEGCPLAKVYNINKYVQKGEVVCCRDITPEYLAYKGITPREGDFKLLSIEVKPENPAVIPLVQDNKSTWPVTTSRTRGAKPAGFLQKICDMIHKAVS